MAFLCVVFPGILVILIAIPHSYAQREITIMEWDLPTPNSAPHDVIVDGNGIVWYTAIGANNIEGSTLPPKSSKSLMYLHHYRGSMALSPMRAATSGSQRRALRHTLQESLQSGSTYTTMCGSAWPVPTRLADLTRAPARWMNMTRQFRIRRAGSYTPTPRGESGSKTMSMTSRCDIAVADRPSLAGRYTTGTA